MDWPYHLSRSLHHQDQPAVDPRGKAKEGPSKDHMAVDGGTINAADGKDLEQHSRHDKEPAEVERPCCCRTCTCHHIMAMSE